MIPDYTDTHFTLYQDDCLEVLKTLPDNSVDAVVTDPPYGLSNHSVEEVQECLRSWIAGEEYKPRKGKSGFMGKGWDAWVPGPAIWKECLRVLKPGGRVLVKCQDMSYGHRLHLVSLDVLRSMVESGFELADQFILLNQSRLTSSKWQNQERARRSHSILWGGVRV